jgi:hypothetical protein
VTADLSLRLNGSGQYADSAHSWTTGFIGSFSGTPEQATFQADGAMLDWRGEKSRDCHLALSR